MPGDNKVVLGLSGGVDSAVCAMLLKQRGYDVTGVFLDIGIGSAYDAEKAAELLGIGFETADIRDGLERHVCAPFVSSYLRGETPNPCVMCNPAVKFPALIRAADRHGAGFVATGHYARVQRCENGRWAMYRAKSGNDQSYMLYRLGQDVLSRLILPLGNEPSKDAVRSIARAAGLFVADKADSMEICFIPDNDYAGYIAGRGQAGPPGDFVDDKGRLLGRHKGIHHYTIGQRRGLGIAAGRRVFVSAIEPEGNRVVISDAEELLQKSVTVGDLNWMAIEEPCEPFTAGVRIRHSKRTAAATVFPMPDGTVRLEFLQPERAPTPGQSAVFYQGDKVLGGGYITAAR